MARKLNRNLIAIGSAAIVGVYALGYVRTQPVADRATAASATNTTAANVLAPVSTGSVSGTSSAPTVYRDGVYGAPGYSRAGEIDVKVTIMGGKIADVQISRATTYFPASRIARLPAEVVDRQTAEVDFVSGATESSRAFRDALSQALSAAVGTDPRTVPGIADRY